MPTFDTQGPVDVHVELAVVGDVTVIASERSTTTVAVRPRKPQRSADQKAVELVAVAFADGRLSVTSTVNWRAYSWFSDGGSIEVEIHVPNQTRIELRSAMGAFRCQGVFGDSQLKTSMGAIRIDEVANLAVETSYGDIVIDNVVGDLHAKTGSGEVRVRSLLGAGDITNSNGSTSIGRAGGDLHVKSANGAVLIGSADSSVWVRSATGSVRIDDVSRGEITVETSYGSLELGVHAGTAAWLDLGSKYGSVDSSLTAADGPETTDDTVEIRARTGYGNVTVRRATTPGSYR